MIIFKQLRFIIPILVVALCGSALLSIRVGVVEISLKDAVGIILSQTPLIGSVSAESVFDETSRTIISRIRLPRLILTMLVGAALAMSGTVMQGFFQNPMADPYIVGVSSGAALGATTAMALGIDLTFVGLSSVPVMAFSGALCVTFLVYGLSLRAGKVMASILLLTGIAIGALASALTSFIMLMSDENLHTIFFWLMGSFSAGSWKHVLMVFPYILTGSAIILVFARDMNVMLLGEESARHLGIEVERVKRILLVVASLLAASAVAVSGIIGFVGLIVPHIMRMVVGPDHRRLLPTSLLSGAILMVLADTAARIVVAPSEMPIGIITAILGCPFFVFLLSRRKDINI